jgi:predicted nucleic acid-binding protein
VILLDTSVLSAVLRRRRKGEREDALAARVAALFDSDENVAIPGIVFQEILSGVAEPKQAERLLAAIRESFPVLLATEGDHLKAADLANAAARKGVALSTPDALIAAQALNRRASLFTTDADLSKLVAIGGLRLYA